MKLSNVPFYLNGVGLAGRNGIPRGLVDNHWDTFAPRVGFAYDVYGNGKTILRGGFGVFYERNAGNEEYNMGANVPFSNSGATIYPYLDTTTTTWTTGQSAGQSPTTDLELSTEAFNKQEGRPRGETRTKRRRCWGLVFVTVTVSWVSVSLVAQGSQGPLTLQALAQRRAALLAERNNLAAVQLPGFGIIGELDR